MIEEQFETIDAGEWYTEYRCKLCGESIVEQAEDLGNVALKRHDCGERWPAV